MNESPKFSLAEIPVASPLKRRPRAIAAIGHETFTALVEIEMACHGGYGASIRAEVEFFVSAPAIPETMIEPESPAEYAIASIRPYSCKRGSTVRHYEYCPPWLEESLVDCIDTGRLAEWVA